jgi:hypothetical protein
MLAQTLVLQRRHLFGRLVATHISSDPRRPGTGSARRIRAEQASAFGKLVVAILGRHPYAIILLRFNDVPELADPPKSDYLELVSDAVAGSLNNYWKEISYGKVDITGSQVFGWYTMKYAFSDLFDPDKVADLNQRDNWIAEAKRLAAEASVDLSPFSGVFVVINAGGDGSAAPDSPDFVIPLMGEWGQGNWKWCNQCGCLTFAGGPTQGKCKAGTSHTHMGSGKYRLAHDLASFPGQQDWSWCQKCMALFYGAAGSPSVCPADNGAHDGSASGNYALATATTNGLGQREWKWCRRCGSLVHSAGVSVCAVDGGMHDFSAIGNYSVYDKDPEPLPLSFAAHEMGHAFGFMHARGRDESQEYGDPLDVMAVGSEFATPRWTLAPPGMNAASLFREGWIANDRVWTLPLGARGTFPVNLAPVNHPAFAGYLLGRVVLGDRTYTVELRNPTGWDRALAQPSVFIHELRSLFTLGQNGWRYCRKCTGLHFMGAAPCPYGGVHDATGSAAYAVTFEGSVTGQTGWQWCRKCQNLTFGDGVCTAGGQHDRSASGNYVLYNNDAAAPGQSGWSWCRKCEALAFSGEDERITVPGSCPAGGWHDFSQSGDYTMLMTGSTGDPTEIVIAGSGYQLGWRWCRRCQALFFLGASPCPGGGYHDVATSDDYSLVFEDANLLWTDRLALVPELPGAGVRWRRLARRVPQRWRCARLHRERRVHAPVRILRPPG